MNRDEKLTILVFSFVSGMVFSSGYSILGYHYVGSSWVEASHPHVIAGIMAIMSIFMMYIAWKGFEVYEEGDSTEE